MIHRAAFAVNSSQDDDRFTEAQEMKKKVVVGLGCLVALTVLLVVLLFTPLGFFVLQQGAGTFDKPRFEAVVQEVRQRALKPGASIELRLDDIHDPKSLRVRKANEVFDRGQGVGNVWATVTADGKLKVVIETRDLGHAGQYGFAYSDAPLTPTPSSWGKDVFELDVPGDLQAPAKKIDDHWWEVYNLLMD